MGKLIIVSSVSGAGKTTLVDIVSETYNLYKLKTCTTRSPRHGESGDEYYFFTSEEFIDNIKNDEFFEYAEVYGNKYGLLKSEIEKSIEQNCIAVLDVQGAETARQLYPNAFTIFIEPPSVDELKYRIIKRNTSNDDVERRLTQIEFEMQEIEKFNYVVKNGSLYYMTQQINDIIKEILN